MACLATALLIGAQVLMIVQLIVSKMAVWIVVLAFLGLGLLGVVEFLFVKTLIGAFQARRALFDLDAPLGTSPPRQGPLAQKEDSLRIPPARTDGYLDF